MSEKTTTEDVEEAYASVWDSFHGYQWDEELAAKFQDWLAEVERAAAEKAWDRGFDAGWAECSDPGAFVNDVWDAKTPNPYGLTAEQERENDEQNG